MKLEKLNCPNCKGPFEMELTGRDFAICPYCGQQIHIEDDGKKIYIHKQIEKRIINEADVIRAKTEAERTRSQSEMPQSEYAYQLRLRELEIQEQRRKELKESDSKRIVATIALGLIGGFFILILSAGSLDYSLHPLRLGSDVKFALSIIIACFAIIVFIWTIGRNK